MQSWRNTNTLYNEWDQGCICWTYYTIPEKSLYRYMEDNIYGYIHKLTQFVVTLNSRSSWSIDLISKSVNNCEFLFILYSISLREFRQPKFKIGDRVSISKYDFPFRKGHRQQFTQEVFEIVAISCRKPPTYTPNDEKDEIIRGKFYRKELIKVIFNNGIVYNRVGFKCICTTIPRRNTELFYNLFKRAHESGSSMGDCLFRIILPINLP